MRFLIWFLLFLILFAPFRVRAGHYLACDQGVVTLSNQDANEAFDGISVGKNCSLVVTEGTTLQMRVDARIVVDGLLRTDGIEEHPVTLAGSNWAGLVASGDATLALAFTTISGSKEGVRSLSGRVGITNVSLVDNLDNRIQIGESDHTYESIMVDSLRIDAQAATPPHHEGLLVQGNWTSITVAHMQIQRSAVDDIPSGIELIGNARDITINQFSHFGCSGEWHVERGDHLWFSKQERCKPEDIPIVFVPGFGGSINLPALADQANVGAQGGWHFYEAITPAYTAFLELLKQSGIHYTIAYYDWRLPPHDIVKQYLLQAIKDAKQKYGVMKVHLVAHSYGGLVARSYIQGSDYLDDVASLTQMGTPNRGAVKAYPAWEAGQVPSNWQALLALVRLYQYEDVDWHGNDRDAIRRWFPSVQSLLPTYPAIQRDGAFVSPTDLSSVNEVAIRLQRNVYRLLMRTKVFSLASALELTEEHFSVQTQKGQGIWSDGIPVPSQEKVKLRGDGTVPTQSALLPGASWLMVDGKHADLPQTGALLILSKLYPQKEVLPQDPKNPWTREAKDMLWFFYDCPVEVTITDPEGVVTKSDLERDGPNGAVISTSRMLWMILPQKTGEYHISVRALADTEVRSWLNTGPIKTYHLVKGDVYQEGVPMATPQFSVDEYFPGFQFISAYNNSYIKYEEDAYILPEPSSKQVSQYIEILETRTKKELLRSLYVLSGVMIVLILLRLRR